jgi:hypothetical protein
MNKSYESYDQLTFGHLRAANVSRAKRWHPEFGNSDADWSGADWSNAMCGEAGEAANVVKKLRRYECGLRNIGDPPSDELLAMLGTELADTVTYADLLGAHYNLDLGFYIVDKFNVVSETQGFPERLLYGNTSI